jgi:adenylate kinase
MRVVLLGPPGVGKGTQGRRLASDRGRALISTGDMLRDAVTKQTALGVQVKQLMDAGRLVSDDVIVGLVRERTLEPDARGGFVLDGFPRTVPQAVALDAMLAERTLKLDVAVLLTATDEELVRRLSSRWECPACRRAYNALTAPSKDGRHCDDHPGTELRQRVDDTEATVRTRLQVYREQTAPLVDFYRCGGRLKEVEGTGPLEEVYAALARAMDQ